MDWILVQPLSEFENMNMVKMFSCREFLLDLQEGFVKEGGNILENVENQFKLDFNRMNYYWHGKKITESFEEFRQARLDQFESSCPHFWSLFCLLAGQHVFARPLFWMVFSIFDCLERNFFSPISHMMMKKVFLKLRFISRSSMKIFKLSCIKPTF